MLLCITIVAGQKGEEGMAMQKVVVAKGLRGGEVARPEMNIDSNSILNSMI